MHKFNLQLFGEGSAANSGADNDTNGTNNPNAEGNGGTDGAAAGSKQTYTQEDLDKIVTERTGRAEKAALKSFFQQQGLTEEEANAAIADYKKAKEEKAEASKNDAKAQADRADAAEKSAQEAIAKANAVLIKSKACLASFAGIIKVPQSRFYSKVALATSGAGGYSRHADGKNINFLIVAKSAVLQTIKHLAPKVVTPEQNQDADAWKFGYRIYGLNDVYENKVAGIYAHLVSSNPS